MEGNLLTLPAFTTFFKATAKLRAWSFHPAFPATPRTHQQFQATPSNCKQFQTPSTSQQFWVISLAPHSNSHQFLATPSNSHQLLAIASNSLHLPATPRNSQQFSATPSSSHKFLAMPTNSQQLPANSQHLPEMLGNSHDALSNSQQLPAPPSNPKQLPINSQPFPPNSQQFQASPALIPTNSQQISWCSLNYSAWLCCTKKCQQIQPTCKQTLVNITVILQTMTEHGPNRVSKTCENMVQTWYRHHKEIIKKTH